MTRVAFLITIFLGLGICLSAERYVIDENISLEPGRDEYQLAHQNIIVHSESVYSDTLLLVAGRDYHLDYRHGRLKLLFSPQSSTLRISYLRIPEQYTKSIALYERTKLADSIRVVPRPRSADWFNQGSNINISGSKTFALSFSESGETDLLQSLYVNLSGELTSKVSIEAQLSDSQSKLSPEGDSKELSSLDQVFIRVYGKSWELGMGDLDFAFEQSRYLKYQTKLEGIALRYDGSHHIQAAFSAGSGKRAQMQIQIIDGKQGPYYLNAGGTQRSYIIVAGTEEIYLDGQLLQRGTDYYIDYADGSVMFRRMVNSTNLINAWFQYSDENYSQSTFFTSNKSPITDRLSLHHHFIYQNDNKNNPLLFDFSDADLDSLAHAGDSIVYSDGVEETEFGDYRQITDNEGNIYYEYAPADSAAIYHIVFSYVGPGNGDYEEFSVGKFRWVGIGNGSWLPVKKLIAPATRSNLEIGMLYEGDVWQSGVDGMYSFNDQNTFSSLDNDDNSSAIFSFWLEHNNLESPYIAKLDAQYRFADIYRFGTDGAPEYDFAAINPADSLAMGNLDFSFGYNSDFWKPQILLRFRDVEDLYTQKAVRISSENKAKGILPATRLQHSISDQSGKQNTFLQHHSAEMSWAYWILGLKLTGLFSELDDNDPAIFGSRFFRWQPQLSINTEHGQSSVAYTREKSSTKQFSWQTQSVSDTYTLKHFSSFEDHHVDLDFSHRRIENPHSDSTPKTSYELLSLRSSHNLFNSALSVHNNYELNQTEFFPRIRELLYVGAGQGVYDSTGVVVDDGEYIWEYITSDEGRLSSDVSAMSSIYFKPGLIWEDPLWGRIQTDLSLSATEQSDASRSWQSYLFLPDYSFDSQSIYGRQSYLQNLWMDLYESRIIGNLSIDFLRSLDNRYQSSERLYESREHLQVDLRGFMGLNTRLRLENEYSKESRYTSKVNTQSISSNFEKVLSPQNTIMVELRGSIEEGERQSGEDKYKLQSISASPQIRSVLMQKYRISARFGVSYNQREGSNYLIFLPQKRQGFNADGNFSAIYRMNSYSSFTIEYRFNKYPDDKAKHNLKIEFKAEL
nr:hypothetical protein [Candidatus Cloacimonadota bacterium]